MDQETDPRPRGEDTSNRPTNDGSTPTRRRVLQGVGTSGLVGLGLVGGSSVATASESADESQVEFTAEPLSPREKGQLRGEVLSSSAFKTIRRSTRERGFRPDLGDVTGMRVTNEGTGSEWLALKVPCDYEGEADDDRTRGAVLFGHRTDDEILARCISQCEGDPIFVDECTTAVGDNSAARADDGVFVYRIPTTGGGD